MSRKYRVAWTEGAQHDLRQIIDYITVDNPGNVSQVLQEIRQKASALYTLPHRGRIVPQLKAQGINTYRELVIAPWRIIYRISDTVVFVFPVIDSRRNLEDILFHRFTR